MTNFEEQGLASLLSKHGCSTGSEEGWTVVTKKHKTGDNLTNDDITALPVVSNNFDQDSEVNPTNLEEKRKAHMGVSPSEANVNKYAALSYWENDDEDEDDEDQDEHQELKTRKTKAPGNSPPLKKIKLESDQYYQGEDIFDKILLSILSICSDQGVPCGQFL